MKETTSKSGLAIVLSRLEGFSEPKVRQEQYMMDSEIGASVLWNACLLGDIRGKKVADLGCGTGMLGIGALLMGAKQAYLADNDEKALKTAAKNILKLKSEGYRLGKSELIAGDIGRLKIRADTVLQNPPFGTKAAHSDIVFLEKALETAPVVYSFHKSETKGFLERFSGGKNAVITHAWDFKFPLKATFSFHRRQIHRIDVSCLRIEAQK
ncbi:methyltransferase [Candidatus Woesearchaeota archaeon]|nr:methyltransferase [Candidatus Woesearchaeota archaeon]